MRLKCRYRLALDEAGNWRVQFKLWPMWWWTTNDNFFASRKTAELHIARSIEADKGYRIAQVFKDEPCR